jgi:hypothetical protein
MEVDGDEGDGRDRDGMIYNAEEGSYEYVDMDGEGDEEREREREGNEMVGSDGLLEIERNALYKGPSSPSSSPSSSGAAGNNNRAPKRPLHPNAPTRFTHENMGVPLPPPKIAKIETMAATTGPSPSPLPSPMDGKSPNKPVSFLEILKKQQQSSGSGSNTPSNAMTATTSVQSPAKSIVSASASTGAASGSATSISRIPRYRLLSRDNTQVFTITKPNGIVMKTTALVSDSRLQGLLKADFNIDGRTKIPEVERFTQELLQSGRRILGTAVFVANDSSSSGGPAVTSGYRRFCDEFTKDQRAGMCTVSDIVQVYLVPPTFKSSISLLKTLTLSGESKLSSMGLGVIWGIVTSREKGSDAFIGDAMNKVIPFGKFCSRTVHWLVFFSYFVLFLSLSLALSSVFADVDSLVAPPTTALPFVPQTLMGATGGAAAPSAFGNASSQMNVPRTSAASVPALASTAGAKMALNAPAAPLMNAFTGLQPTIVPAAVTPAIDLSRIRQIAEDIARSGVAALQSAQNQPNARQVMPFLFPGNTGHTEFMAALKSAVERNKMAKASAFQMQAPNAFGGPSAFR